jgi:hypothetical protein
MVSLTLKGRLYEKQTFFEEIKDIIMQELA